MQYSTALPYPTYPMAGMPQYPSPQHPAVYPQQALPPGWAPTPPPPPHGWPPVSYPGAAAPAYGYPPQQYQPAYPSYAAPYGMPAPPPPNFYPSASAMPGHLPTAGGYPLPSSVQGAYPLPPPPQGMGGYPTAVGPYPTTQPLAAVRHAAMMGTMGFAPMAPFVDQATHAPRTSHYADSAYEPPTSGASSGEGHQHRQFHGHLPQTSDSAALATQSHTGTGSSSDATSHRFSDNNGNATGSGSGGNSGGGSGKESSDSGNSGDGRPHHPHHATLVQRHTNGHSSTGSSSDNNGGGVGQGANSPVTFTETHARHPPTGSTRHGGDFGRAASNQAISEQRQLIVKFLTDETSDDQLRALFEQFGPVENARQVIDKKTGHTKGFGFVTFVNACDTVKALHTMRGYQLCGRQLNVALAQTERARDF